MCSRGVGARLYSPSVSHGLRYSKYAEQATRGSSILRADHTAPRSPPMDLPSLIVSNHDAGGAFRRIRAGKAPLSAGSNRQYLSHIAAVTHTGACHRLLQGDEDIRPEFYYAWYRSKLFCGRLDVACVIAKRPIHAKRIASSPRVYFRRRFKMRCSKKGLVAPGSSEVITVDFHPREHRYHYDCLRLHTDSENLLVPLHGYPVSRASL